jgi:hypothetical protein
MRGLRLTALASTALVLQLQAQPAPVTVFTGATLIDGTGAAPVTDAVLVVRVGRTGGDDPGGGRDQARPARRPVRHAGPRERARPRRRDHRARHAAGGPERRDRYADFVVLTRNPHEDIRNTRTIESVWIGGRQVEGGDVGGDQ